MVGCRRQEPNIAEALEVNDPGVGSHWARSRETGFILRDELDAMSAGRK